MNYGKYGIGTGSKSLHSKSKQICIQAVLKAYSGAVCAVLILCGGGGQHRVWHGQGNHRPCAHRGHPEPAMPDQFATTSTNARAI